MIRLLCSLVVLMCLGGVAQGETNAAPIDVLDAATPLSKSDVKRYKAIFRAQERGAWKTADAQIRALENKILLGYVLEQRYMHPTAYRASFRELSRWLSAYPDHPNAAPVYRLAKKRQGRNLAPRRPTGRRWRQQERTPLHPKLAADYENNPRKADVKRIERRLRYLTRKNQPAQALNYLNNRKQFNALTAAQTDRVRGWVAASFYYDGDLRRAKQVADRALKRSWDSAVLSHWIAGLVAWRQNDPARAFEHFAAQADIPYQEEELRAAGAFWAARAALAANKPEPVTEFLSLASRYPLTFYGQLALGQLGLDAGIDWHAPSLTQANYDQLIDAAPRIERAIALVQVGKIGAAEDEMKWAQGEVPAQDDAALAALAAALPLPSAQLTLAQMAQAEKAKNAHLRAGLFPIPSYTPNGGFTLDPALLYGLMRQESKFVTEARSKAGAKGLMQLMPRTASYVAGTPGASRKLYDPGYNMQLGQSYVEQLLTRYNKGSGDLFEMTLSYNWGPGNFSRWKAKTGIEDQLLMLESVPNTEARHFVETVLTNIWVYRDRLDEPAPSRDAAAAGEPPVYESVKDRLAP
ncbi:MAG: lytic transglycosylase domain-containing protein [Pseudomonadota bacterium]